MYNKFNSLYNFSNVSMKQLIKFCKLIFFNLLCKLFKFYEVKFLNFK